MSDCQRLASGLRAALRSPKADMWSSLDGVSARWTSFFENDLAKTDIAIQAAKLTSCSMAILSTLESENYDWPPGLNRAIVRQLSNASESSEQIAAIDAGLLEVQLEAQYLGQPGDLHLKSMEQDVADLTAIGRALLVGTRVDLVGAGKLAEAAYDHARIIENELEVLARDNPFDRDLENGRRLSRAARAASSLAIPDMAPLATVVPSGTFQMGARSDEIGASPREYPRHHVTIGYAFAIGVYAVTFQQWDLARSLGAKLEVAEDMAWGRGARPAVNVSWHDALAYIAWLNSRLGLDGRPDAWRLPSEAEWEFACRAGTSTAFNCGDEISTSVANFKPANGLQGKFVGRTLPVGSFAANAFGVYDMHGNVREWTADCWNASYAGAPNDGSAWLEGDCARRVVRGGSWNDQSDELRSASRKRSGSFVTDRYNTIGFRIARTLWPVPVDRR